VLSTATSAVEMLALAVLSIACNTMIGERSHLTEFCAFAILAIGCMAFAGLLAMNLWPLLLNRCLLPKLPGMTGDGKCISADEVVLAIMLGVGTVYATLGHLLGNHLWGCMLAGMSFSRINPPHYSQFLWDKKTGCLTEWAIRIFFSATLAFSIASDIFFSLEAFGKGVLLGIVLGILGRLLTACWLGPSRLVVGASMIGSSEVSFLSAQLAVAAGVITESTFASLIWALLITTSLGPLALSWTLTMHAKETTAAGSDSREDLCRAAAQKIPHDVEAEWRGAANREQLDRSDMHSEAEGEHSEEDPEQKLSDDATATAARPESLARDTLGGFDV